MTRFCFNPSDPTLYRYPMTQPLMDEGFVECPPPGEPIPPTLLSGAGGVSDQAAATMGQLLREKMGKNPTEDQLQAVAEFISNVDMDVLLKGQSAEPPPPMPPPPIGASKENQDPDPNQKSAMGAMESARVDPSAAETDGQPELVLDEESGIIEMYSVPMAEVSETPEAAVKRYFGRSIEKVNKTDICNYGLQKMKVQLDMSKVKPLLIKDLQMVEIARQNLEG